MDGGVFFFDFVFFGLGDVGDLFCHVNLFAGAAGDFFAGAVEVADEFGSLGDLADLFFVVFVGVLGVESKSCDVGVLVSVAYLILI